MSTSVWFDGEYSFIKPGMEVKLGDAPLTISFDKPADTLWGEDKWFCFDIFVKQYSDAKVSALFYPKDSSEPLTIQYELLPNMWQSFRVLIDELWSRRYFLRVFPGAYKSHCRGLPTDPASVERVVISVLPGKDFKGATLKRVYVSEEEPVFTPPRQPMIDEMGQLIGFDWPTKTHSVEEMTERLKAEYKASATTMLALIWQGYRNENKLVSEPITRTETGAAALAACWLGMNGHKVDPTLLSRQFGCSERQLRYFLDRITASKMKESDNSDETD